MREAILKFLRCPACKGNLLTLNRGLVDNIEIRGGEITCGRCAAVYKIEDGIIDFLNNADERIMRERRAMDAEEYITDASGNKYRITEATIEKFKDKFLAMPQGDRSYFFKRGGSFQSITEASDRFYSALENLRLTGREKILEIGASFSFASSKFAKIGCSAVALDIGNYLKVSSLFVKNAYYDRVFSDMHNIPFQDNTFDIVFGAAVLHHSNSLKEVFSEIHRVLKTGGRVMLINEPSRGIFERVHPVFEEMEKKGYGDISYTIPDWLRSARRGGFKKSKIEFLSLADDYITRHKNRDTPDNFKLRLARFFQNHRGIEKILLAILILPRLLFRQKSWRLSAYK
ncbi:MAG: methyltransferase domain-containing protein [Candidatus Omnitrophica bacterium]|nr:methyltransferase domain-containing protein [Candidatus Omnitrophota bacterium]